MKTYFVKNTSWAGKQQIVICDKCGMVINQSVYEMTTKEWGKLNDSHRSYQGTDSDPNDPNWIQRLRTQADVLAELFRYKVLNENEKNIDYGCGDGKLSDYIMDAYEKKTGDRPAHNFIGKYDKYMRPANATDYYNDGDVEAGGFDFVVSCSVFEHLRGINEVDSILSLVKPDGIVGLHTLVCEQVPQDPDWYYLSGCHCTIWTNKAMQILYQKNNFKGCAYHVEARMWFFFKDKARFEKLKDIYREIPGTWVLSDDFVDYWKQKPYRTV
jgi:hypothetical protein